jgi:hypothetical protein
MLIFEAAKFPEINNVAMSLKVIIKNRYGINWKICLA